MKREAERYRDGETFGGVGSERGDGTEMDEREMEEESGEVEKVWTKGK
jgi:hypothetical protein